MRRASFFLCVLAPAAVTIFAVSCGDVSNDEALFAGSGGAASLTVTTSHASTTKSTGTHATATTTGGAGGTAGAAGGSSSGGAAGAGTGGATTTSSSSGMPLMIDCAGVMCAIGPMAACCFTQYNNPPVAGICVLGPIGGNGCDGTNEVSIECEAPSQCPPGQICCGHEVELNGPQAHYDHVTCQATCDVKDATQASVTFCTTNGDCPTGMGLTGMCSPSSLLPGDSVCH